ncbi:MAG: polysaccharide deacetylase family protein [Candidatus Kerfeldbacteria bacterium]|nr:polysaccharide deacetylase family protein [Candidatus Kerfeldbacteria bacterium]
MLVAGLVVLALVILVGTVYYLCFSPSSQLFGRFPFRAATTSKVLALTFDDGPNSPHTEALLAVLRKHGVRATFFLVGKNLERSPHTGQAIVADGHEVGNHTYAHAFSNYFSPALFKRDVEHNQGLIAGITGTRPTLFRPPWLFRLPWILHLVQSLGLTPVSGVFGSEREVFQPSEKSMVRRALQKVKPGMIIIFHDGYNAAGGYRKKTITAIDQLIPKLKGRGYNFVSVQELLKFSQPET